MATRIADHREVIRRRLTTQFLTGRGPSTASDVVRALGAVQAQDYAGAKWAVAMRTRDETDANIDAQVDGGRILRTHVLRPTWHFVAPDDIRWMLALTGPRVKQSMAYHGRNLEIDARTIRRSHDAIANALAGGRHLTRPELGTALGRARVTGATGQRLAHLVMEAELDGIIVNGARRGKHITYALLDERVPPAKPRDRDESLHALARLYFTTRGPATVRDFSWWSGLSMVDAKRGLAMVSDGLEHRVANGEDAWFDPRVTPKRATCALLLPNYDEYFIGYKDRSAIGKRVGHTTAVTGGAANITHVALIDGELVGGWRRRADGKGVAVAIELWSELTPGESDKIARATKAFGRFLGVPVNVTTNDGRRTSE
jgi:hypothetical protein